MVVINFRDIVRQGRLMGDYHSVGLNYEGYNSYEKYREIATLFGSDIADAKRKEERREEAAENAHCNYDFDSLEVYDKNNYHTDCKKWIDITDKLDLPIRVESTIAETRMHDGDFNYTTTESRIWRFVDEETHYNIDFEICPREMQADQHGTLSGKIAHTKFIWAREEDQKGWFICNKSLQRFAKILFIDGVDYLEGWALKLNSMPCRDTRHGEWRNRRVPMKDKDGNLSKNKGIALLAYWLRHGFMITGEKQGDKIISYISPNLYHYITKEDKHCLDDAFKYARRHSYDINTIY